MFLSNVSISIQSLYLGSCVTKHFLTSIHRKLCSGFTISAFIVASTDDKKGKVTFKFHTHTVP